MPSKSAFLSIDLFDLSSRYQNNSEDFYHLCKKQSQNSRWPAHHLEDTRIVGESDFPANIRVPGMISC